MGVYPTEALELSTAKDCESHEAATWNTDAAVNTAPQIRFCAFSGHKTGPI